MTAILSLPTSHVTVITYFTRDHARQLAPHLAGHPFLPGCEHMQLHLFSHVHACTTLTQRRQLTATVVYTYFSLHIILLALHFSTRMGASLPTHATLLDSARPFFFLFFRHQPFIRVFRRGGESRHVCEPLKLHACSQVRLRAARVQQPPCRCQGRHCRKLC